jgi:FkbM family methyltransferase
MENSSESFALREAVAVAGGKPVSPALGVSPDVTFWMRFGRFLKKPGPMKVRSSGLAARRIFPRLPIPVRLPWGSWELAWQNDLGNHLLAGEYEGPEYEFVRRFLRKGMVVLDIGANEGFYTLLAAHCVGENGFVIAFEPSPRERHRLRMNLGLNLCGNVRVEGAAVADREGVMSLHVVQTAETGCNSLRPPAVQGPTKILPVDVTTVDRFLRRNAVQRVDFVKMDVEGAELLALKGAQNLFRKIPRPLVLIEVSDLRTIPWGYRSREILDWLCELGFVLFSSVGEGQLELLRIDEIQNGSIWNVLAVPPERAPEIGRFLMNQEIPASQRPAYAAC